MEHAASTKDTHAFSCVMLLPDTEKSYEKVGSDLESYMLWCIQIQPKKTQAILKTTPIINYKVSLPEDSWKPTSRN